MPPLTEVFKIREGDVHSGEMDMDEMVHIKGATAEEAEKFIKGLLKSDPSQHYVYVEDEDWDYTNEPFAPGDCYAEVASNDPEDIKRVKAWLKTGKPSKHSGNDYYTVGIPDQPDEVEDF